MANQRRAGAILSYVSLAVNVVVSLAYVPLLLGFLTASEYGVYELIGSVIAYLSVMDMGLSTALSRFYVKTREAGDIKAVQNLLATAAVVYGVLTVLAVLAAFGADALLDVALSATFTAEELELAHEMMCLVAVNCAVALPGNWFMAVANAHERFVFLRLLSIVRNLLQAAVALAVLALGSGAVGVLAVQVVLSLISTVAAALFARRLLDVPPKLWTWDWGLLRDLASFCGLILLNMVFDQVFWKTGQVVLAATCGAGEVAVYAIACKVITSGFMSLSNGVTGVFLPKLTQISARTDDMTEIDGLFRRIGRIQAVLVWGVLGAFLVLGGRFISLWAGPELAQAFPVTCVLMAGLSVALVQNLGVSVLQAKNRMGFRASVYTCLAVLDVVLSIPASQACGVVGCAVVAAVLLFVGTGPVMNWYYHHKIGIDIPAFWREVVPLLGPALFASAASFGLDLLLAPSQTWGSFVLLACAFMVVYIAVLWAFALNDYEKGLVLGALRGGSALALKVARKARRGLARLVEGSRRED